MKEDTRKFWVRKVNGILEFATSSAALLEWDEYIEVSKEEYIERLLSCEKIIQRCKTKTLN